VQDHDTGEAIACAACYLGEGGFVDGGHEVCGLVADVVWGAVVLLGAVHRSVANLFAMVAAYLAQVWLTSSAARRGYSSLRCRSSLSYVGCASRS